MEQDSTPGALGSNAGLGPNAPTLTIEQVCNIGFAVLRAHNDDRLWRALTYDSGPYDLTTPNLALQQLGGAFYAAGASAERERIRVALMALHERTAHHNYYHCAVVSLFGA